MAGIQVDRYTLDNVFDQTLVNNTTLLWDYTAFTWSHAENEPKDYNGDHTNSDAFLTASLDVVRIHRYIVWVKFEIGIKSDGNGLFWYSSAVADLICFFPWIEGGFCPSD